MTQDKGKGLFSQAGGWLGIVLAVAVVFTTYEKYGFVHSHLSLSQCVLLLQELLVPLVHMFLVMDPSPLCSLSLFHPSDLTPPNSLQEKVEITCLFKAMVLR